MADVPRQLSDPTIAAICIAGAQWPRSFLSATVVPDSWIGLVEKRDGRRRFVPSGEDPRPDADDWLVLVRNKRITTPIRVESEIASCGRAVEAAADLLVRWPAREDDLSALRRTLLVDGVLSLDGLARFIADAGGRDALREHVRSHDAATLVDGDTREALGAALVQRLKKASFDSGMVVESVAGLRCTCAALEQERAVERSASQRMHEIKAREAVEQAAAAAAQRRIEGLSGLLATLRGAAKADESMKWHALLPALSPAERGKLLENLWRISPDHRVTTAIAAVGGNECVWLDPRRPETVTQRRAFDDSLGGLRSVAFDAPGNRLLIGAATGVWVVDAATGEINSRYAVADAGDIRTGFNGAAIIGGSLFATHSQLGCRRWTLNEPDSPGSVLEVVNGVPKTVRCPIAVGEQQLLFAADDCIQSLDVRTGALRVLSSVDATIHALAVGGPRLYVSTADGKVLELDLAQPDDVWVTHRTGGPIESLSVRCWNDLVELVLPGGAQGIVSLYPQERVVTRLVDSPISVRRAWAGDDIVVGLSERRDRLIVLAGDATDRSGVTAALARITGTSIQDVCLVSAPAT